VGALADDNSTETGVQQRWHPPEGWEHSIDYIDDNTSTADKAPILISHLTCGFTEESWKEFRRQRQYLRGDDPRILAIDTCTKEELVEIYSRNRAEENA
jgi:hypothetical protein